MSQEEVYQRYQNGYTKADKQQLASSSVISQQFVDFVNNWSHPDVKNLEQDPVYTNSSNYRKQNFYKNLFTNTLHVQWGNYTPTPSGSGNNLLIELRYNGSENVFELTYAGFDHVTVYKIPPEHWVINSNSIEIKGGVYALNFKQLSSQTVENTKLWNHQFSIEGNLQSNYYALPFHFQN